jgi:hypothetical protein
MHDCIFYHGACTIEQMKNQRKLNKFSCFVNLNYIVINLLQHCIKTFGKILIIGNINVVFPKITISFIYPWHGYQSLVMAYTFLYEIQFGNMEFIYALNPSANLALGLSDFTIKT